MEIQLEENEEGISLTLPAKVALPQSVQLKSLLMQALSQKKQVTIDFLNVQDVKTPFVQALISAVRTFRDSGQALQIRNLVSSIESTFLDLGLSKELSQLKGK